MLLGRDKRLFFFNRNIHYHICSDIPVRFDRVGLDPFLQPIIKIMIRPRARTHIIFIVYVYFYVCVCVCVCVCICVGIHTRVSIYLRETRDSRWLRTSCERPPARTVATVWRLRFNTMCNSFISYNDILLHSIYGRRDDYI